MVDVIGAGFGRTGTASLKVALEHLGLGPCHHMFEVVAHPELLPRWERVVAGEDVDWDEVLEGYRSTVDWPGCAYWRDLMGPTRTPRSSSRCATPSAGTTVPTTRSTSSPPKPAGPAGR